VDQAQVDWQNRAQFLGVAARRMRHILVDHARELCRGKRGGGAHVLPLDEGLVFSPAHAITVPMHDPLKTGTLHGILSEVAHMRSITIESIADLL
jgi:hypothetical protein